MPRGARQQPASSAAGRESRPAPANAEPRLRRHSNGPRTAQTTAQSRSGPGRAGVAQAADPAPQPARELMPVHETGFSFRRTPLQSLEDSNRLAAAGVCVESYFFAAFLAAFLAGAFFAAFFVAFFAAFFVAFFLAAIVLVLVRVLWGRPARGSLLRTHQVPAEGCDRQTLARNSPELPMAPRHTAKTARRIHKRICRKRFKQRICAQV
jgi:hypothetical protein